MYQKIPFKSKKIWMNRSFFVSKRARFAQKKRASCSFIMSDLSKSLTVVHFSWATWANLLTVALLTWATWTILLTVTHLSWAIWAYRSQSLIWIEQSERMREFPTLIVHGLQNGQGWSEYPKMGQAGRRIPKWSRLVGGSQNGPGWLEDPKMAPACQKTPKMAEGCSKDPNGPGLLENTKMVQAVWRILKWSRLVEGSKNGPGLSEDPKMTQTGQRGNKTNHTYWKHERWEDE